MVSLKAGSARPTLRALALQRRRLSIRLRRLGGGFLQHGEADLQPVVRRQTLLDQGGKQDGAFAELFDDLDLRRHVDPLR